MRQAFYSKTNETEKLSMLIQKYGVFLSFFYSLFITIIRWYVLLTLHQADPGDNTRRVEIKTHEYIQVVIYDHVTRRKA